MRKYKDHYDLDDKTYSLVWQYYRLTDLVVVYEQLQRINYSGTTERMYAESWFEYLNGGRTEYLGFFAK